MTQQIHKDMTIEEIFETFPQKSQKLAQEMQSLGLQCVGCGAASFETLEAGVLGHGLTENDLNSLIERLNRILEQKVSLDTITLTKRAAEKFKAICAQENKKDWALRFGDKPGGCSGFEYVLDFSPSPSEEDEVFTCHGVDIHIHKTMVQRLMGCEIDYQDGLNGSGFKISNPNVKSSCSCGSSQAY